MSKKGSDVVTIDVEEKEKKGKKPKKSKKTKKASPVTTVTVTMLDVDAEPYATFEGSTLTVGLPVARYSLSFSEYIDSVNGTRLWASTSALHSAYSQG